jgi:hypothetical protein
MKIVLLKPFSAIFNNNKLYIVQRDSLGNGSWSAFFIYIEVFITGVAEIST